MPFRLIHRLLLLLVCLSLSLSLSLWGQSSAEVYSLSFSLSLSLSFSQIPTEPVQCVTAGKCGLGKERPLAASFSQHFHQISTFCKVVKVTGLQCNSAHLGIRWWELCRKGCFFDLSSPFFLLDRKVTKFWNHLFLVHRLFQGLQLCTTI
jgi:hypothetical protein